MVADREYYADDMLETVKLLLGEGSTGGCLIWVDELQVLTLGQNECEWKFVPTDSTNYREKTGTVTVVAVEARENPQISVNVVNEKVYAENELLSVKLQLSEGDTDGVVEWIAPSQVLVAGSQTCEWKFIPTDTATYKTVYGSVVLDAVAQVVTTLEVMESPTKTAYKPFDGSVTLAGMVLKATYDGGKVETLTSGWTVTYQSGSAVTIDDTKVIANYGGIGVDIPITVSKIELNNPQILGEYVYNGEPQKAQIKQTLYTKYYEASNDTYTDAGNYKITLTLKDTTNFKWRNSETAELLVDFFIKKVA